MSTHNVFAASLGAFTGVMTGLYGGRIGLKRYWQKALFVTGLDFILIALLS